MIDYDIIKRTIVFIFFLNLDKYYEHHKKKMHKLNAIQQINKNT
jgi:hypothetical protein